MTFAHDLQAMHEAGAEPAFCSYKIVGYHFALTGGLAAKVLNPANVLRLEVERLRQMIQTKEKHAEDEAALYAACRPAWGGFGVPDWGGFGVPDWGGFGVPDWGPW